MATIIILNGTSSSGKTTLAKALQQQFDEPYLHAGIDNYIFMLPKQYLRQPLWGSIFHYTYADDGTIEAIETGQMGHQLISTMHHAVQAIADSGFNVIMDHVLLERGWLDEMMRLLAEHTVWFIGVKCPLDVLEQREKDRKDRTLGQAKAQYDVVHKHHAYDFEVDTSNVTSDDAVDFIRTQIGERQKPTIFAQVKG